MVREHHKILSARTAAKKDKQEQGLKQQDLNGARASFVAGLVAIWHAASLSVASSVTMFATFVASASIKLESQVSDQQIKITKSSIVLFMCLAAM